MSVQLEYDPDELEKKLPHSRTIKVIVKPVRGILFGQIVSTLNTTPDERKTGLDYGPQEAGSI